ncbi:hypothetical protein RM50_19950 [Pseudarthrobacter phenanthrenivorans]|uniref:Uncharacterized protein n=2 Tax=Pseudarthrobacter phenanthrenivorans TaxID=361575 RepID=A0A0B4E686_PSEPS|nr:hypothetical protein RM50_19950 [Pseudarthrobacter phenanthrenivorans]
MESMPAAGAELAGVNIMTMKFGPLADSESMPSASGQDAARLGSFAAGQGVRRISLWSANRHTGCAAAPAAEDRKRPSSHCSGIDHEAGKFAAVLGHAITRS